MTFWQKIAAGMEIQPVILDYSRIPQDIGRVPIEAPREEKHAIRANVPVKGISKREVMNKAHKLRRECHSADFSLCLREAWRLVKIEALERERFVLNMRDQFRPEDWERSYKIDRKLNALKAA